MASEPMLPRFSWIQEQDAVIRIIQTSGECCVSGGMQAHFDWDAEFHILCWGRAFPRARITPSGSFLREDRCRVFLGKLRPVLKAVPAVGSTEKPVSLGVI